MTKRWYLNKLRTYKRDIRMILPTLVAVWVEYLVSCAKEYVTIIIENTQTSLTTSHVLHKIMLYFCSFNNFNKRIALFRWQKHDLYKSRKLLLQAICTKLIKFPRQQTTEIMAGTIIYLSNNEIRALKIGWKNWQSRKERLSTIVVQTCDSARVMGRQTGRSTAHVNHA